MKKIVFSLLLGCSALACNKVEKEEEKEEKMESRMEGSSSETDGNNIEGLDAFRESVNNDIKKGDSVVIFTLRKEITALKEEIESLKTKK